MARLLPRQACEFFCWQSRLLSRLPCDIGLAFDETQELEFVRYLAPQVAKWTLVGHAFVFCCNVMNFIWNIVRMDIPWLDFESGTHDVRTKYAVLTMISLGIHLGAIAALSVHFLRVRDCRCEIISIFATALLAIMHPWLDPWHGVTLYGGDPYEVWGPGAGEYEALRILSVVSGIHAYALYVPIRWRFCFIIPLCCTFSIIVLLCTLGSSFEASTPFLLPLVAFLLFAPALGQRSHEVLVRERWRALHQVHEIDGELHDMQAMSGVLCDVSFKLTSTFCFVAPDKYRDAFFGQDVEGKSILDLLSEEDGERLMSSARRMSVTHIPENLSLTLKRQSGIVEVRLFLVEATRTSLGEDPTFLASLMISKEPVSVKVVPADATTTLGTVHTTLSSVPQEEKDFGDVGDLNDFDGHQMQKQGSRSLSDISFTYSTSSASISLVAPPTRLPGGIGDLDGVVPQVQIQRAGSRALSDISFTHPASSAGISVTAHPPMRMPGGIGDSDGVVPQRHLQREDSRSLSDLSFTYPASSAGVSVAVVPTRVPGAIGDTDPQRQDRRLDSSSMSELSFTLSSSSGGLSVPSRARILHGITEGNDMPPQSREMVEVSTQTSEDDVIVASAPVLPSATTQDVAVNTTCVWRNDAFACMTCAKPPKLPGPLTTLPPRARRRRKKKQQQQKQYDGDEFDGEWSLRDEGLEDVPDWLRMLIIDGAHVVFGDLTSTVILMGDSPGEYLLRSGTIWLEDDGTLVRKGSSGRMLCYDLHLFDQDDDCTSECSSIASCIP
eukprot:TRINITY_DN6055_c1_g1_i3.p1 TRINITY_DN6055_c1_g1~~TRINITY_DN6055_c1_g1_i3.p1  ORF type:complete len:792 (-),score=94.81 TRINITY_DN6055_c1_g1_i3:163-2502(-)